MQKIGVAVGEEMWTFFGEIFTELTQHYDVTVFKKREYRIPLLYGRLNRWLYQNGLRNFLKNNDLCFFEWASEHLEKASHLPQKSPIVTRLHSFELYDWAPKINWDNVDKIIFISESMRKKFFDMYPKHGHKTVVIHNAVNIDKFQPTQREFDFSIGMMGNIAPIKRFYEIILLVKELVDQGYSPSLHIAGGAKNKDRIDRYYVAVHQVVNKLNLQDNVKFYGHVNNPHEWLHNIDIFISNSYWEGLQTTLLEAMASGCYCLGHFWDGIEEALPPEYIYSTEIELIQKLTKYASLSTNARLDKTQKLVDIVHNRFNIHINKIMISQVINSLLV